MGDFAQLPPVLTSNLMSGLPMQFPTKSGMRILALAGRNSFASFTQVIRLRRIHRIQGANPYKDSTMRLRDAAITTSDYDLWRQHELGGDEEVQAWPERQDLRSNGLYLVCDNQQAGKINGQRLADTAPTSNTSYNPVADSSESIIVRCEARHNHPRGERRKAADFRNIRKAVHLRVGAKVILTLNSLWDVTTVPLGLMSGASR